MRVVYSEYTKKNITDIANYTEAKWGTAKRVELIGQIANSIEMISEFPRSTIFDIDLGLHYKLIPKLPFVIVYLVGTDFVRVIKILHNKQQR